MRRPAILDVVQAVNAVALQHREVAVWWYAPWMAADGDRTDASSVPIEVIVQADGGPPDLDVIRARLSEQLGGAPVTVHPYDGTREHRRLYRLLTRRP